MTEEEAFLESVWYGKTDFQARTKERDDARAVLARTKFLLSALERSYGLAPAEVIFPLPKGAGFETLDVLEDV